MRIHSDTDIDEKQKKKLEKEYNSKADVKVLFNDKKRNKHFAKEKTR